MDLYGRFLQRLVFPLGDRVRGVPIGQVLGLLSESQWWPANKIQELQSEKLRILVGKAYEHVPYYRRLMDKHGIRPADIQTVNDLTRMPLLTKDIVHAEYPDGLVNRSIPRSQLSASATSGSTGQPKQFYLSRATRTWDQAAYYRCLQWCGADRGEHHFLVWGAPVVMSAYERMERKLKTTLLTRQTQLSTWKMEAATMERFLRGMRRYAPVLLRGYTTSLTRLGRFAKENGLDIPPVKAVNTTAEQVLEQDRVALRELFNAPVFDQYGCGECNGIASECAEHRGLHVFQEHCVVEILDDEGAPVAPGQPGRVVLTNLDNEAFPFIRYVCGDVASWVGETCPCGRNLPLLSGITGRIADTIYGVNGNRVWGWFFAAVMMQTGLSAALGVKEFVFVQTGRDRLRLDLASDREPTPQEMESLCSRIREYLGPMQIDSRRVTQVDRGRSGKLRYAIQEWQPSNAGEPHEPPRVLG
jgi:phenylacetate-CoA ligase